MFVCGNDELGAIAGGEFGEQAADVGLDGVVGDGQLGSDVVVGVPARDERQDFCLSRGELSETGRCVSWVVVEVMLDQGGEDRGGVARQI